MTSRRRIKALESILAPTPPAINRDPLFEAEREKAILAHPESKNLVVEVLRSMVQHVRNGTDPDEDAEISRKYQRLHEIGGGHWNPLGVMVMHDDEARELSYALMDALRGHYQACIRSRHQSGRR